LKIFITISSQLINQYILRGGKMRIPFKNKLLVLVLLGIMVYVGGCVDTSVQTIPDSIDYRSQIKIVNLVSGGGTATLTLNNQSLGTLDFGNELPNSSTAFLDIPSGNKVLSVNYSADSLREYRFAADTEYKLRVYLVGTPGSAQVVKNLQRYVWQSKDSQNGVALFPSDTGHVAFFNGSPDAAINSIAINGPSITEVEFDNALELGQSYPYSKLKAGNYTFTVVFNDSLETNFDYNVGAKGRYTVVFYNDAANMQNKVLVDD
jgi:hypothetical protein